MKRLTLSLSREREDRATLEADVEGEEPAMAPQTCSPSPLSSASSAALTGPTKRPREPTDSCD